MLILSTGTLSFMTTVGAPASASFTVWVEFWSDIGRLIGARVVGYLGSEFSEGRTMEKSIDASGYD